MMLLLAGALAGAGSGVCAAPKPKTHTVVIEAMQFSPRTVEVSAGDAVIWENKDFFPHTATSDVRNFDSGAIPSNGSWKFKARRKGTFPYFCTLHPTMRGTLIVK